MTQKTESETVKPTMGEVTGVSTSTLAADGLLEPGYEVLKNHDSDAFKTMAWLANDDQVKACLQQRSLSVVAKDWEVDAGADDPASQAAAEFIREQLHKIRFDSLSRKMLRAVFVGYSVAECLWEIGDSGLVEFKAVKVRRPNRFRFTRGGEIRLLGVGDANGQVLPERKIWTFTHGADNDDQPYGEGLAEALYWPVFFKRHGIKNWNQFLENLSKRSVLGKYPNNATQKEKDTAIQALLALQKSGVIAIPQGMSVEDFAQKMSSTPDYSEALSVGDAAISKIILGQTMTTDDGSSQSQATVHKDVRDDIVAADADELCASFNHGPVTWLTEWNFPGATPPRVWRDTAPPADQNQEADTIHKMAQAGWEPTQESVNDSFVGEWQRKAAPSGPAQKSARILPGQDPETETQDSQPGDDFAESQARPFDSLAHQAEVLAAPAMEEVIEAVKRLLNDPETSSLEDLAAKMVEAYPTLSQGDDLAQVMGEALAVANLQGRADMLDGI